MNHNLPAWVEALKHPEAYPQTPKSVGLTETHTSYLFRADELLYKVKKPGNEYPSPSIKEVFCRAEARLLQQFNHAFPARVVPVHETSGGFQLEGEGSPVEYALEIPFLRESGFLNVRLDKEKAGVADLERIGVQLAETHATLVVKDKDKVANSARPEAFRALCEDFLYQLKRYFDASLTQPILDMIRHPLEKFLDDNGAILVRRLRKGRVVGGHGAFLPEHLHLKGETITVVSPQEVHRKYAVLDVANDVAALSVELMRRNRNDLRTVFLQRYIDTSKDRELNRLLPLYETFQALKQGVNSCEMKVALQDDALGELGMDYFQLAVRRSRDLSHV